MTHPHETYGKVDDNYLYGIREIYVMASTMESSVGDCKEAANSDDARDKYFFQPIHEFDVKEGTKLDSLERDVISRTRTLDTKVDLLLKSLGKGKVCLSEKEEFREKLQDLGSAAESIQLSHMQLKDGRQRDNHIILGFQPGRVTQVCAKRAFLKTMDDQGTHRLIQLKTVMKSKMPILKPRLVFTGNLKTLYVFVHTV